MFAEVMCDKAYRAYRVRLETLLHIPVDASDQDIHELIEAGFSATSVKTLCDLGALSPVACSHIISLNTLNTRLARGQHLSVSESDRLFRHAHITAMAEVLFGDGKKARRWLSKSKARFSGENPIALLSTSPGTRLVEEMLIQVAEGLAF
ncbi:antitoxin [Pseudomonas frederiksbergensis]|uniref:Antitoxin n=1 Tax=Pseudomonas frederiksbergensis TaxID=104087 RepID=A0A1J0EQD6_9PSED|nr:antitoxin Xre/MbcA/ParS toxin-binding domain-containing protein [Pseudomonas frederiksbergensis]APC18313.1 antitoxin [Pseudomonas frederiksbergensis]